MKLSNISVCGLHFDLLELLPLYYHFHVDGVIFLPDLSIDFEQVFTKTLSLVSRLSPYSTSL